MRVAAAHPTFNRSRSVTDLPSTFPRLDQGRASAPPRPRREAATEKTNVDTVTSTGAAVGDRPLSASVGGDNSRGRSGRDDTAGLFRLPVCEVTVEGVGAAVSARRLTELFFGGAGAVGSSGGGIVVEAGVRAAATAPEVALVDTGTPRLGTGTVSRNEADREASSVGNGGDPNNGNFKRTRNSSSGASGGGGKARRDESPRCSRGYPTRSTRGRDHGNQTGRNGIDSRDPGDPTWGLFDDLSPFVKAVVRGDNDNGLTSAGAGSSGRAGDAGEADARAYDARADVSAGESGCSNAGRGADSAVYDGTAAADLRAQTEGRGDEDKPGRGAANKPMLFQGGGSGGGDEGGGGEGGSSESSVPETPSPKVRCKMTWPKCNIQKAIHSVVCSLLFNAEYDVLCSPP